MLCVIIFIFSLKSYLERLFCFGNIKSGKALTSDGSDYIGSIVITFDFLRLRAGREDEDAFYVLSKTLDMLKGLFARLNETDFQSF